MEQQKTKVEQSEIKGVKIVRIISESKRVKGEMPRRGYRRVMAVVSIHGKLYTRHCDTKDGVFALMRGYRNKMAA